MKNTILNLKRAAAGLTVAVVSAQSHAALPTEVTTAMGDAATDGAALAVLGLLIVIAIAAVKYLRSAK